jgi:hypothetical protein
VIKKNKKAYKNSPSRDGLLEALKKVNQVRDESMVFQILGLFWFLMVNRPVHSSQNTGWRVWSGGRRIP